jgi:hypothetical protein
MNTTPHEDALDAASGARTPAADPKRRWLAGLALLGLCGVLGYVAFRGYFTADMLFGLASMLLICH